MTKSFFVEAMAAPSKITAFGKVSASVGLHQRITYSLEIMHICMYMYVCIYICRRLKVQKYILFMARLAK